MKRTHTKEAQKIFGSAARTATATATFNCASLGGLFFISCTADPASASVVFNIDGECPETGETYTIIDSAAISATGLTVIKVHPSLTGSANTIAKDILPSNIKVTAVHADADSITYSMHFVGVN